MQIKEKVSKESLVDILCDICGESCTKEYNLEVGHLEAFWGYGSKKDGESTLIELCEDCFDKMVEYAETLKTK